MFGRSKRRRGKLEASQVGYPDKGGRRGKLKWDTPISCVMIHLPPLTPITRHSFNGAFFFALKRYEVLMLGHPDVFDDQSSISRFDEFDTLVLAGVDALSDTHVALLTAYVQRGGRLVLIGSESAATRDEELRVRPEGPALASLALHPDLQGNGSVFERSEEHTLNSSHL